MRLHRWAVIAALCAIAASTPAFAAAPSHAGSPATSVPSSTSAVPHPGMPTYAGPDGVRVPLGACAVVQGGKVLIVACDSPPAKAYKASVAAATRRRAQHQALWGWGGLAALAFGVAGGIVALWRKRRAGTGADAPVTAGADADSENNDAAGRLGA